MHKEVVLQLLQGYLSVGVGVLGVCFCHLQKNCSQLRKLTWLMVCSTDTANS